MAIWDDVVPSEDLQVFAKAKLGGKMVNGERPAIIVVDMTYGYVDDPYCSKMAWPAVSATKKLLGKGREVNIPIFFTRGTKDFFRGFREKQTSKPIGESFWKYQSPFRVKVFDPKDCQIVQEIAPLADEVIIEKIFPSAFFGTNLASMLIYNNVDTLIVTGLTTSGCVRATVVEAFSYNLAVIVPEECVGDRGLVSHKVSLFDIQMKYANVLPISEVIKFIDECRKE